MPFIVFVVADEDGIGVSCGIVREIESNFSVSELVDIDSEGSRGLLAGIGVEIITVAYVQF